MALLTPSIVSAYRTEKMGAFTKRGRLRITAQRLASALGENPEWLWPDIDDIDIERLTDEVVATSLINQWQDKANLLEKIDIVKKVLRSMNHNSRFLMFEMFYGLNNKEPLSFDEIAKTFNIKRDIVRLIVLKQKYIFNHIYAKLRENWL